MAKLGGYFLSIGVFSSNKFFKKMWLVVESKQLDVMVKAYQ